jgi:NTP pyrophosphatase (non-canonical NTP hydrolase)
MTPTRDRVALVLGEVAAERARQDARWGPGNLVYRADQPPNRRLAHLTRTLGEVARALLEAGDGDPLAVLVEEVGEVAEALAARDLAAARAEAVQVAAVAAALAEGIDRHTASQAAGEVTRP